MKSLRTKYILGLAVMTIVLVAIFIKFPNIAPFGWAIGTVIFLFLCELANILITDRKRNTISPQQSVNLLMGLKVGKILLSLCFLLIYWMTVKTEMKRFLLVFFTLYLIYLVFDTLYLINWEKEAKKKKLLTKE